MSTLLRYQTLVSNIGRVYSSADGQSTACLHRGLDEIVNGVKPDTVQDWVRVKADSDRLLKVWCAKEKATLAAVAAKDQIHDILVELTNGAKEAVISLEVSDTIRHVNDVVSVPRSFSYAPPPRQQFQPAYYRPFVDEEEEDLHSVVIDLPSAPVAVQKAPVPISVAVQKAPVPIPVPVPVSVAVQKAPVTTPVTTPVSVPVSVAVQNAPVSVAVQKAEDIAELEEEDEEEENLPGQQPLPVAAAEEAEEEEEEEEEEAEEEEEEAEEEVVEPEEEEEAAEEEEEGLEVEQVTIRGRTYWLDSNTKKLYANLDGDEVGDEVGAMVNGKPLFLAA